MKEFSGKIGEAALDVCAQAEKLVFNVITEALEKHGHKFIDDESIVNFLSENVSKETKEGYVYYLVEDAPFLVTLDKEPVYNIEEVDGKLTIKFPHQIL